LRYCKWSNLTPVVTKELKLIALMHWTGPCKAVIQHNTINWSYLWMLWSHKVIKYLMTPFNYQNVNWWSSFSKKMMWLQLVHFFGLLCHWTLSIIKLVRTVQCCLRVLESTCIHKLNIYCGICNWSFKSLAQMLSSTQISLEQNSVVLQYFSIHCKLPIADLGEFG